MISSEQNIIVVPKPTLDTPIILKQANKEGDLSNFQDRTLQEDAIYVDYDISVLLKKIQNFPSLPYHERLSYTKHVIPIFIQISNQHSAEFSHFLQTICEDCEDVRSAFLHEFKQIFAEGHPIPSGLHSPLVKCLVRLLHVDSLDIKEQAARQIGLMIGELTQAEREDLVLKQTIILAHDSNQQNQMVGVQLLSKLATCMPQEVCDQFVAKQILVLGTDHAIRVKKEAMLCIPILVKAVSQGFLESTLLTFFQQKCAENSWALRKVCVSVITSLAASITNPKIRAMIAQWLIHFLKDGNKIVRIEAHLVLPLFMASVDLSDPRCSETFNKLFDVYLRLVDSQVNQQVSSNELLINIAFSFPGVLASAGSRRWQHLQNVYMRLLKFNDKQIRRPLACGLHEVAKMIGADQSRKKLFGCLDNILKDPCDQLKLGAISHLWEFLGIFDHTIRQNLIDILLVLQKDPRKWRIRHSVASQIGDLCKIYESDVVFKYMLPISLKLCSDPVSEVRLEACKHIWVIAELLKGEPALLFVLIESLKGFAVSTKFHQRQSFLLISQNLLKFPQIMKLQIIPAATEMLSDPLPVVRVLLARLVYALSKDSNYDVADLLDKLKKDQDIDVREVFEEQE